MLYERGLDVNSTSQMLARRLETNSEQESVFSFMRASKSRRDSSKGSHLVPPVMARSENGRSFEIAALQETRCKMVHKQGTCRRDRISGGIILVLFQR